MNLEDFISISARLFSLPARTGAVWQDGGTCRADSDGLWISKRNKHLSDKCSGSSYIWKLDLKIVFRMSFTSSLPQETLEGTSMSYLCLETHLYSLSLC